MYILSSRLYNERLSDVQEQMTLLHSEQAQVYMDPMASLKEAYSDRLEVASITRKLKLAVVDTKYEAEILAAKQDYEVSAANEFSFVWFFSKLLDSVTLLLI